MPELDLQVKQETRASNTKVASPQTFERSKIASFVLSNFFKSRDERDRSQPLFRDRTFREMLNDNVKRFIQFKQRPAHKKRWQSNLASTTPYEKLMGILSKIATQGMETRALSLGGINMVEQMKERVINSFGKAAALKNNDDFQIILEMLEAGEKGTVIGFEDWYHGKRQIREVINQDPKTGELEFDVKTIKEWNDVRGSIVNMEDFYPGNQFVRPGMIQDMDDCFLRSVMTEDEFNAEFGNYPDADKVRTVNSLSNESTPFWRQSEDVSNDEIEVIRYFNQRTDEYVIEANEIWINSMDGDKVQPLPWNHKKLPFWAAVYAPFDAGFFWGRSLIDLLIADTDSKDGLMDRMMDAMTVFVSRPVLSDGNTSSALTKGFIQPHNVITTDWSEGRPNFQVLPIPEPPAMGVTLLQLLDQRNEKQSIAAENIGSGGRVKTATQAGLEAQGAAEAAGLFRTLMEHGIRDKYRLRYPNMLQFYTLPSNADNEEERFRKIILRDEKLSNGKTGNLQIDITNNFSQARVDDNNRQAKGETEFIEVTPDFIRNFRHDVMVVPASSIKMTPQTRQILELNYQRVINELYPDLIDREKGFDDLNKAFDKDTEQMKAEGEGLKDLGPGREQEGGAPSMAGVGGVPARTSPTPALAGLTTI